ncbi:hypothetical protein F5880DRAFT_1509516 [Lentinula raphanica]|nr:hypothetical protein F5880DRAFT_1509516 [Lentinula raphanica]
MNENGYRYSLWICLILITDLAVFCYIALRTADKSMFPRDYLIGRRYERQKVLAIVLTSPSGNDYLHSEDTRQVVGSCSEWSTHKASCGSVLLLTDSFGYQYQQRVGAQRRRSGSEYQIREHCSRNAVGDRKKVKEVQLGKTAVNGEQRLASDIALGDVA